MVEVESFEGPGVHLPDRPFRETDRDRDLPSERTVPLVTASFEIVAATAEFELRTFILCERFGAHQ